MFERSVKPMLLADDERRFVDANPAACLLLRQSRAEILGLRIEDIVSPQARETIDVDWQEFLVDGGREGRFALASPGRAELEVAYSATAHVQPGLHLGVLTLDGAAEHADDWPALTERERQVMRLLALGLDGPRIAAALSISNPTVQTHVRNAMTRLGARTRAHAVALALTRGELGL